MAAIEPSARRPCSAAAPHEIGPAVLVARSAQPRGAAARARGARLRRRNGASEWAARQRIPCGSGFLRRQLRGRRRRQDADRAGLGEPAGAPGASARLRVARLRPAEGPSMPPIIAVDPAAPHRRRRWVTSRCCLPAWRRPSVAGDRIAAGRRRAICGRRERAHPRRWAAEPDPHKDLAVGCGRWRPGVGNGLCVPAGPLRAPLAGAVAACRGVMRRRAWQRGANGRGRWRGAGRAGLVGAVFEPDRTPSSCSAASRSMLSPGSASRQKFFDTLRGCGLVRRAHAGFSRPSSASPRRDLARAAPRRPAGAAPRWSRPKRIACGCARLAGCRRCRCADFEDRGRRVWPASRPAQAFSGC